VKWIVLLLIAASLSGCVSNEHVVAVTPPTTLTPEVSIHWTPLEPEPHETVQFSFTSNVNVTAACWNFGDEPIPPAPEAPTQEVFEPAGPITIHSNVQDNFVSFSFAWNLEPTAIACEFNEIRGGFLKNLLYPC
jgi:hypothetical protein